MQSTSSASPSPLPLPAAPLRSLHHHLSHLAADLTSTLQSFSQAIFPNATSAWRAPHLPVFASASASAAQPHAAAQAWGNHAFDVALSTDQVAQSLKGTSVYTVSNSKNEFVLISDPSGAKSLGLLCFSKEDAKKLLAQVQLKQPAIGRGAKVVPITLDQVYSLKVEGIAFRFLPDAAQVMNALKLQSSDMSAGFDGVPVFQSDHLSVTKARRRYLPLYFRKEDIVRDLKRLARGTGTSQSIMVGSLEDVLKKMEKNKENSGWDHMIFIPPGTSCHLHLREVSA